MVDQEQTNLRRTQRKTIHPRSEKNSLKPGFGLMRNLSKYGSYKTQTTKQLECKEVFIALALLRLFMARNFGHARAVNIQTWENMKQYGYTKL